MRVVGNSLVCEIEWKEWRELLLLLTWECGVYIKKNQFICGSIKIRMRMLPLPEDGKEEAKKSLGC